MKHTLITTSLLFFSFAASAALTGNWALKSGPVTCPQGQLQMKKTAGSERHFLFGSNQSWTLTQKDKDSTKEIVPEGCTYESSYELASDKFTATTIRKNCPDKRENVQILETLQLQGAELKYQRQTDNQKTAVICSYNKI